MVEVKILLDQEMYPDATEGILRAIINDALGVYKSYDPKAVTISETNPLPERVIDSHTAHQITYASKRLQKALEAGLIAEVLVYALKAMQESKGNQFIGAAIDEGCNEWDV